jgi:alpha-galactosidase
VEQIAGWKAEYETLARQETLPHQRSREYASHIMEAIITGVPYKIGGNLLNAGGAYCQPAP